MYVLCVHFSFMFDNTHVCLFLILSFFVLPSISRTTVLYCFILRSDVVDVKRRWDS